MNVAEYYLSGMIYTCKVRFRERFFICRQYYFRILMKARYRIIPENELIVKELFDSLYLKDLKLMMGVVMQHPDFPCVKKVYTVLDNCELFVSYEDIQEYAEFLESYLGDIDFRWALLTDKPDITVVSILLQKNPYLSKRTKIFSTEEAALSFLGISESYEELLYKEYEVYE